jgi:hypothetical protein
MLISNRIKGFGPTPPGKDALSVFDKSIDGSIGGRGKQTESSTSRSDPYRYSNSEI